MIPLSIDIPVDNPIKPIIHLHSPPTTSASSSKSYRWNTQVFDEEKMSDMLEQTHHVPLFINWLYKRMTSNGEPYLIEHGSKRSHTLDHDDFEDNSKSMKMDID